MPQLPPESATATALRLIARDAPDEGQEQAEHDPDTEQWSRLEQLVAAVRDELHIVRWLYISVHSDRGKGPKWRPEPLPRPGITAPKRRKALEPEQQSLLAQHLARTQGGDAHYN